MKRSIVCASALLAALLAGCASQPAAPQAAAPAPAPAAAAAPAPAPAPAVAAPAPAAPPPAWQQGRPASMADSKLAPLAGKNTVTAASDIPLDKLKLPAGFKVEIWSTGTPGIRAISRGASGKVYGGTRGLGRVYEITDNGKERSSRVVVDKLNQPAAVIHKGNLYVMAIDKALRFDGIEKNPNVAPVDMTAAFKLPPLQHHNWKYLRFGPDGKLYVPFGGPCNICELPTQEYAQIRRYNADGSGMEVIATGVRNSVGFDFHPVTKELWFSNHGRDWMGDDTPEDGLFRLGKKGQNFGFPYCHLGAIPDPDVKKDNACAGVTGPVTPVGAHAAAMGVHFYTGKMFPAEYQNSMLIAQHGSWNRTVKHGYNVIRVTVDDKGKVLKSTPFLEGFLEDPKATPPTWGRPVDVLQLKDGSVLVSDDFNGIIYRISYKK